MKIDRNNYEPYFIDYIEGNLDEKLVDCFIAFLTENPDLKEELELFESGSLIVDNIHFNKKESLYKNKFDAEKIFNHAAVADLEGDLDSTEKENFEIYLATHPDKRIEADRFKKTKLVANPLIVFNKKGQLYHKPLMRSVLLWSGRVAAVLILAFVMYKYYPVTDKNIVLSEMVETIENPLTNIPVTKQGEVTETRQSEKKKVLNSKVVKLNESTVLQQAKTTEQTRVDIEAPPAIEPVFASLNTKIPKPKLQIITLTIPADVSDERYLAEVVAEKTGLNKISLKKITWAGLNLISKISKEKIQYETNEDGQIKEVTFDSRLLAFSIPTQKNPPPPTNGE